MMLTWLAIIVAFVVLQRLSSRMERMEDREAALDRTIVGLRAQIAALTRPATEGQAQAPVTAPPQAATPAPAPVRAVAAPRPVPASPPRAPAPAPVQPAPRTGAFADMTPAMLAALSVPPVRAGDAPPRTPPPASAPPAGGPPRRPTPPPAAPEKPFDWEKLIGVKLFSWIAGAALALAGVFFLRYSLDSGWLGPQVRMAIGLLTGISLLVVCELKAARRYPQTANAMDASGIALLFATIFASHALWHLIPSVAAVALLLLVTGVAVLLSIRRDSMFIAVLGLLGGFATPVMLASGKDDPIGLFSYLLLLNVGLAWVAYRKRWPLLTGLSMVLSTLYQWGWVMRFLTPAKLPIAVAVFLLFPIVAVIAFVIGNAGYASGYEDGESPLQSRHLFAQAAQASAALPLFFGLYLAAVPAYGQHYGILFAFLFCISAGLYALGVTKGPRSLHTVGAAGTVLTFAIWMATSYTAAAWPVLLAIVSLFVLFYLAAPVVAEWWGDVELEGPAVYAVLAAPALLFMFPALLATEPRAADPGLPFGVLFVLLAACAWFAIAARRGVVHYLAAFFALMAEAVWASRFLDPARLYSGLALFGAFGLFYVGTPLAARRWRRPLEPAGSAGLLTLASLAVLLIVASGPAAESALWGLALLVALLNVGLYIESSVEGMPKLSLAGSILSWAVLGLWWFTAKAAAIVPALVVMGGFAMLTMVGNAVARRRADSRDGTANGFDQNVLMGLVGHVFIAFVVTRPELSIPPWPVLGALAVLDLAVVVVGLYLRRGTITIVSTVATAVILMLWTGVAQVAPWPLVAVISATVSAALAFCALAVARRVGAPRPAFAAAAAAGVLLALLTLVVALAQQGAPALAIVVGIEVVLVAAALFFSWLDEAGFGWATVVAVLPAGAVAAAWQNLHGLPADWSSQLIVATPVLLLFIANPLVMGRRVRDAHEPYVAAVLASAVYFFLAKHALFLGGFEDVIGALPVAQALLLVPVLSQLVRFERDGAGRRPGDGVAMASGRLALVAGATLACVTLAIPLQLEKNWVTIGWAIEGAALLWLVRRIPHPGLLASACALLGTAFVRLALNPAVLSYHSRGAMPILNWYLYTYLLVAAALFLASRLVTDDRRTELSTRLASAFATGGAVLLFLLLNIEIADYHATGATITFNFNANLAQDLTYTIGWALFALALLAAGIISRKKASRIASIALLVVTVLKCFLHDLGRLGGLYRVGSFVGLALCLALVAIVLQKFVLARDEPQLSGT